MSNLSDREALDLVLAEFKGEIHTCFPARVLTYNAEAQTVDVRPAVVRTVTSENPDDAIFYEELPDIYAVPVQWPRGAGFALTFPIAVGDWVMVHCAENALHVWRQRGIAPSKPGINDEHGLNGCLAFPGCYPDKERLGSVNVLGAELRGPNGGVVRLNSAGTVDLCGDQPLAMSGAVAIELGKIATAIGLLGGSYTPGSVAALKTNGG